METTAMIEQVDSEGSALLEAAQQAGWSATVPRVGWDVGQLVRHTGGVHRRLTDLVTGRVEGFDRVGDLIAEGPADDELARWYAEGLDAVVAALREAPVDLQVPTLMRSESPREFWARRMAHETAVHRADVVAAGGGLADFAVEFAQDGLDELMAFARGRPFAIPGSGTLALLATDGDHRVVRFGGERNVIERGGDEVADADAIVRGASAQLYLWVWNRDADVIVEGAGDVTARWADHVRIRRG